MANRNGPRPVRLKAPLLGVVCRKCVKRVGGDGKKAGKQLTRALRDVTGRKLQAADVGCLKLCPKHRVVVVPMHGVAHVVDGEDWLAQSAALLLGGVSPIDDGADADGERVE